MRASEDSHWWYIGLRSLASHNARRAFAGHPGARVLDAGCGTGGTMEALRRTAAGATLLGVDVSTAATACTRTRNVGCVARASVEHLPFPGGAFDVVLSLDVLYGKGVDDRRAVAELYRVLRPGGTLLVNVAAFEYLRGAHDLAVHTARRYTKRAVRDLLARAGFEVEKVDYWNALLFPVLVPWRLLSRVFVDAREPRSDLRRLPAVLNWLLTRLILADIHMSRHLSWPFGSSVFATATKPAPHGGRA